jgi:3'-phosphoadenosine 5'-phosphosulfate sulfotransferase
MHLWGLEGSEMTKIFLFVRDTRSGFLDVTELGTDRHTASIIYSEAERHFDDEPWVKVILLGSESLEMLRATHSNWFPDWEPSIALSV